MEPYQVLYQEYSEFDLTAIHKGNQLTLIMNDHKDKTMYCNMYEEEGVRKMDSRLGLADFIQFLKLAKQPKVDMDITVKLKVNTRKVFIFGRDEDQSMMNRSLQFKVAQFGKNLYDFQLILRNERNMKKKEVSAFKEKKDIAIKKKHLVGPITEKYKILPQANSQYFEFNDNWELQYAGPNQTWTQYIFNHPIFYNQSSSFKLKISKLRGGGRMAVGVVDYKGAKDKRCSFELEEVIFYSCSGHKYFSLNQEGRGFKRGDVVEIDVDRKNNVIDYIVNGYHQATQEISMNMRAKPNLMPFVEMYYTGDSVQLILDSDSDEE